MRWIGILGIFAALAATSADAQDANMICRGLFEEVDGAGDMPARDKLPLLMENRCEAMKRQELRAPLMRVPQEEEDPMELSFGIKNNGGMLRFKIPFSF